MAHPLPKCVGLRNGNKHANRIVLSGQMAVEGPSGGAGWSVAVVAAAAAVAAGRRQRESTVTQRHGRGLHLSVVVPLVRGAGKTSSNFKP
jgi:hypothetical protein